jgi:hypothetical protein
MVIELACGEKIGMQKQGRKNDALLGAKRRSGEHVDSTTVHTRQALYAPSDPKDRYQDMKEAKTSRGRW